MDFVVELDGAIPTLSVGDEAKVVNDELIVENKGVDLDFDEVNCNGQYLYKHDVAKGVCHACVCFLELEFKVRYSHHSHLQALSLEGSVQNFSLSL
uniref:Uncharacterized protein n=1 Tax=Nelumbo nucifera TaxID=4432 RepID=A0A822ZR98_NELNU|nr:TPA_asm: hypothetical protein HUJ06_003696 [Nelumbo nucifera]